MDTNALAIVALGSNLGEPARSVMEAIQRLREFSDEPLLVSSLWQTAPVDCPPGSPFFVNAVVAFAPRARENPESLLEKLQAVEREFGRQPKKALNEPRPLDLDLIAFRREVRRIGTLVLPHPRARERRFVLEPLAEILPELKMPGESGTVRQLLAALPLEPAIARLDQG